MGLTVPIKKPVGPRCPQHSLSAASKLHHPPRNQDSPRTPMFFQDFNHWKKNINVSSQHFPQISGDPIKNRRPRLWHPPSLAACGESGAAEPHGTGQVLWHCWRRDRCLLEPRWQRWQRCAAAAPEEWPQWPQRDGATEERRMGGQVWAKRGGSEPHFGFDSYRKNYVGRLPLMIVVF